MGLSLIEALCLSEKVMCNWKDQWKGIAHLLFFVFYFLFGLCVTKQVHVRSYKTLQQIGPSTWPFYFRSEEAGVQREQCDFSKAPRCSAAALERETETQASRPPGLLVHLPESSCTLVTISVKPSFLTWMQIRPDLLNLCSHPIRDLPSYPGRTWLLEMTLLQSSLQFFSAATLEISVQGSALTIWSDSLISTGANSLLTHNESNQTKGWVSSLAWFWWANAVLWPGS